MTKTRKTILISTVIATMMASASSIDTNATSPTTPQAEAYTTEEKTEKPIKKVMFIGDSMTGWLAERLNAYGKKNGFEVATIVWDGSTMQKWGKSPKLASLIKQQNPDAVMICLGMNELFEKNPETRLKGAFNKIKAAIGDRPMLWVGPPSWPGHKEGKVLNDWLEKQLGEGNYFNSSLLQLNRQSKTNPHPSKAGIIKWMDTVVDWIPEHSNLNFQRLDDPEAGQMSRGSYFVYKRMKESL